MEKILEQQLGDLRKSLFIYRIVLLILAVAFALTAREFTLSSKPHKTVQTGAEKKDLPYYHEVMDILHPLIYSAFPQLVKADTTLSIDFDKKIWALRNVHRFDAEGRLVLENGRYGLCGELAAYVYQSLLPVLKNQFELKFEKVSEAGYFLTPQSIHIILSMTDRKSKKVYLIDPGFNRYGRREDFDDYLYFGSADTLSFLEQKSPDSFFHMEEGTPIVIRKDTLLSFSVEPVEGLFDKENFMLALSINRRYKFSGRFIFAVRKFEGKVQTFENKWSLDQMLGPAEFAILQHQIMSWFDSI